MAFRISKAERTELDNFATRLAKEQADLTSILEEQTAIIEAAYEKMNGAIDTYNGALADARGYVEDLASQVQSDFDDKSDRWQEGERGEATREWIDALDTAAYEMDELANLEFEAPAIELTDVSETINNLEDEPSY